MDKCVTADRGPPPGIGRIPLPRAEGHLIMLLDMDAFFASVEQVARPQLRGKPVIVGGLATDRSVVASASYEARALGVKTAMPIAQAYRLCPTGVFLRGNYALYESYSRKVLEICNGFTPLVEPASIDEAYMDFAGTQRLYASGGTGGTRLRVPSSRVGATGSLSASVSPAAAEPRNWPVGLAERLLRTIRQHTGLGASIGIGSNKMIARIATQQAKPGGICFVWPGYEAPFLERMPLSCMPGIGPRTAAMLADYNLRTAGDVQRVDRQLLTATFGRSFGQVLYDSAWGRASTELEPQRDQKSIARETSFERDTTDVRYLRSMLYYLVERACRRLRQMGRAARTVAVKLRYSDFETLMKSHTLAEPTNHDDVVYRVAEALLTKLYVRPVSVRLVGVHLSGLVDAGQAQLGIWQGERHLRARRLYEVSDRIRDRFGFCALLKGPAIELMDQMAHDENGFQLRTSCLTR